MAAVQCPHCQKQLSPKRALQAAEQVRCPACKQSFQVSPLSPEKESPPDSGGSGSWVLFMLLAFLGIGGASGLAVFVVLNDQMFFALKPEVRERVPTVSDVQQDDADGGSGQSEIDEPSVVVEPPSPEPTRNDSLPAMYNGKVVVIHIPRQFLVPQ